MLKTALAALLALVLAGGSALAIGSSPSPSPAPSPASSGPSPYDQAVEMIEAQNYNGAIPLLEAVTQTQPNNADAWNYLGFAYRSVERYDEAFAAYNQALLIDPHHIGANEYMGELYLMTGDLDSAEQMLQVLANNNCAANCEAHDELKDKIAEYKQQHGS
jgi:Flp pilus assembly protein TadD